MSNKTEKNQDWLSDNEIDKGKVEKFIDAGSKPELNVSSPTVDESHLVTVPMEAVPTDVVLVCPLYIRVGEKIVTLRSHGEKLTTKRLAELKSKRVASLFVHKDVWSLFLEALETNEVKAGKDGLGVALYTRELLVSLGLELEKKFKESKKPFFDQLQGIAEKLATKIHANPAVGGKLLIKPLDEKKYFISHCINSALYAAVIAYKLRLDLAEIKSLTYAVLVHDIGKLFISNTIWNKPSLLKIEEKKQAETHPRQGAEFLQSVGAAPAVVQTALQHHERIDGTGYPSKISGLRIHPFAKICAVADAFDSLTTELPYQEAISPLDAIKKLREAEGQFDPKILGTMGD